MTSAKSTQQRRSVQDPPLFDSTMVDGSPLFPVTVPWRWSRPIAHSRTYHGISSFARSPTGTRSLLCQFYGWLAGPAQTCPALRGTNGERGCCVCVSITPSPAARLAPAPTANADIHGSLACGPPARCGRTRNGYGHQPIIQQSLADHGTVLRYGLSDTPEHPAPVNQPRHVRAARPAVALQTPDEDQKARRRPR